jgi:hypothetical protein
MKPGGDLSCQHSPQRLLSPKQSMKLHCRVKVALHCEATLIFDIGVLPNMIELEKLADSRGLRRWAPRLTESSPCASRRTGAQSCEVFDRGENSVGES